jgi:hypothetical protein
MNQAAQRLLLLLTFLAGSWQVAAFSPEPKLRQDSITDFLEDLHLLAGRHMGDAYLSMVLHINRY